MAYHGTHADAPARKHLRHWDKVCRYIETQPYRSVAFPFPKDAPMMSVRLLKRMARFGLIRHRDDCTWRLAKNWWFILQRLWDSTPNDPPPALPDADHPLPFVVDAGIDTLYVNLLAAAMPLGMLHACEALKALAQARDEPIETPWQLWGAPLSMWKAGKGSSKKGKGTSWGYILRNEWVELRLRKTAVGDIVGRVHFLAKLLWVHGPRPALDAVAGLLETLWFWDYDPEQDDPDDPLAMPRWQTSEMHLCADIAHFTLQAPDLERVITRSIHQVAHVPSLASTHYGTPDFNDEWEDEPDDFVPDLDPDDLYADPDIDDDEEEPGDEPEDEDLAQDEGAEVHLWAKRVSGFSFSPGGDLMVVFYDKPLQEKAWDIDWMRAIHEAGGWDGVARLTRTEARLRRPTLRGLKVAFGNRDAGWIDDPYQAIQHQQDCWSYVVGLPPEADVPDVAYRGWLRLAVATEDENRGRWPTDPVWHVIQRAHFSDTAPVPLVMQQERKPNLLQLDAEVYGLLKLRSVLRGAQLDDTLTIQQEMAAFYVRLQERDKELDDDKVQRFPNEVREKARMMGKAVPLLRSALPPPKLRKPKSKHKLGSV
jgi:hypothetical protein